jgi:hypothetical protein
VFGARTRRPKGGGEFSQEEKHDANDARFVASLPWDEDPKIAQRPGRAFPNKLIVAIVAAALCAALISAGSRH